MTPNTSMYEAAWDQAKIFYDSSSQDEAACRFIFTQACIAAANCPKHYPRALIEALKEVGDFNDKNLTNLLSLYNNAAIAATNIIENNPSGSPAQYLSADLLNDISCDLLSQIRTLKQQSKTPTPEENKIIHSTASNLLQGYSKVSEYRSNEALRFYIADLSAIVNPNKTIENITSIICKTKPSEYCAKTAYEALSQNKSKFRYPDDVSNLLKAYKKISLDNPAYAGGSADVIYNEIFNHCSTNQTLQQECLDTLQSVIYSGEFYKIDLQTQSKINNYCNLMTSRINIRNNSRSSSSTSQPTNFQEKEISYGYTHTRNRQQQQEDLEELKREQQRQQKELERRKQQEEEYEIDDDYEMGY